MKLKKSLILASASPRRKELMQKWGYDFEVVPAQIDETSYSCENIEPAEYAKKLAEAKAVDVASKFPQNLTIGADTIVDFNGYIIGKPDSPEEARQITVKLFSCPHKVITALAIVRLCDNARIIQSDTTIVYPRKMTPQQIDAHIRSGNWKGKAGAYGIQESGDEFVEKIEGSFTNVMGMPMELLGRVLKGIGYAK